MFELYWKAKDKQCFEPIDHYESFSQAQEAAYQHADDSKMVWFAYPDFYFARKGLRSDNPMEIADLILFNSNDEYLIFTIDTSPPKGGKFLLRRALPASQVLQALHKRFSSRRVPPRRIIDSIAAIYRNSKNKRALSSLTFK